MTKELYMALAAVPSTMITTAVMAGATSGITHDPAAAQKSVYATGLVLVVASMLTKQPTTVVATMITVGAVILITNPIWFKQQGL